MVKFLLADEETIMFKATIAEMFSRGQIYSHKSSLTAIRIFSLCNVISVYLLAISGGLLILTALLNLEFGIALAGFLILAVTPVIWSLNRIFAGLCQDLWLMRSIAEHETAVAVADFFLEEQATSNPKTAVEKGTLMSGTLDSTDTTESTDAVENKSESIFAKIGSIDFTDNLTLLITIAILSMVLAVLLVILLS